MPNWEKIALNLMQQMDVLERQYLNLNNRYERLEGMYMSKKEVYYISIPFLLNEYSDVHATPEKIEEFMQRALEITYNLMHVLEEKGKYSFSPVIHSHFLKLQSEPFDHYTYNFWYKHMIQALGVNCVMVMVNNCDYSWRKSHFCMQEYKMAKERGLKILEWEDFPWN